MSLRRTLFDRSTHKHRIPYDDQAASSQLAAELLQLVKFASGRPIIFVCIGTDRSTGDSLGPLIGTFLEDLSTLPFHVYGTLESPIHAVNLAERLDSIKKQYTNPFIIGIDACLGKLKSVGHIQVGEGPVKPGAGVQKELPDVGHAHITGIVNVSGFMEFFVLQNTRLHLVFSMARKIADGIKEASALYQAQPSQTLVAWQAEEEVAYQEEKTP